MKYSVAGIVFGCHPPKAAASGISFLAKYPERGWMKPENLRLPRGNSFSRGPFPSSMSKDCQS